MKKIKTVKIWKNGKSEEANLLIASSEFDNLISHCSFSYKLCSIDNSTEENNLIVGQCLANGSVEMNEDEYLEWDGSNESAYIYIADKLNLTIL